MKRILNFCEKTSKSIIFFYLRLVRASKIRKSWVFFPAIMNALNAAMCSIVFDSKVAENLSQEFGSEHIDL